MIHKSATPTIDESSFRTFASIARVLSLGALKMTPESTGAAGGVQTGERERVKSGLLAEDCKGRPLLSFQIISCHYSSKTSSIKRGQTDPATAAWLLKAT